MSEVDTSTQSTIEFLKNLEGWITVAYEECFTDETKKIRNLVLITGFVLILFVLGVLSVSGPFTIPLINLSVKINTGLRWVLIILCAFFLFLLCARSYIEWHLWRLKHQAPMFTLQQTNADIASALAEIRKGQNVLWEKSWDLYERIWKFPFESGEKSIENTRKRMKQEHQQVLRDFERELSRPEIRELRARQEVIDALVRPIGKSLKLRFWIEAFFPIAFGLTAILSGIFFP